MKSARPPSKLPPLPGQGGFTVVEVMLTLAMILVVGGAAITCMIQLNRQAEEHRLYSCASAAVNNEIQVCLTDGPFVPQQASSVPPSELTSGTQAPVSMPLDPLVTGTMNITVATANSSLNVVQITVSVTYTYRSRNYTVTQFTMRASDV